MSEFKVNDRVETPAGIGIVVYVSDDRVWVGMNFMPEIEYKAHQLKPYKSGEAKLLELGYAHTESKAEHIFTKTINSSSDRRIDNFIVIRVNKAEKSYVGNISYNDYFNSKYSSGNFAFDVELSRVLIQFIEEMRK